MKSVLKRLLNLQAAILLAIVLPCFSLLAVPARPGIVTVRQPDGTPLRVRIIGDEYAHLIVSETGEALVADEAGWLCYALFSADGQISDSGCRYGTVESGRGRVATASVISGSRDIPYAMMRSRALENRRLHSADRAGAVCKAARADSRNGTTAWPPANARAIALLVQFRDVSFTFKPSDFRDMLCKPSYSAYGGTGSALDWFNDQYKGATAFTMDVGPVVTVSHNAAWYAQETDGVDRAAECVYEACRLSDSAVDFSRYDFVYVFYAGGNSADGSDPNAIWPHAWSMSSYYGSVGKPVPNLTFDGVQVDAYAMSSELCMRTGGDISFTTIGTFCHEFSHILGQYDLYDTDYESSGGYTDALYSTSIMCSGSYNNDGATPPNYNALELQLAGLLSPETISAGAYSMAPISDERRALKIEGENADEYYLIEARRAAGWDKYIGGSGMLVYHVDRRSRGDAGYSETYDMNMTPRDRWDYNEVNCRPDFQCCRLVSPVRNVSSDRQLFWPYGTNDTFGVSTDPALTFRGGDSPLFTLKGIRNNAGTVSFSVLSPLSFTVTDSYQDAVILGWQADLAGASGISCRLRLYSGGKLLCDEEVRPYADGVYAYTVERLKPGTEYSARVDISVEGVDYNSAVSFSTKPCAGKPFIVMNDYRRIPLRVYNARGAVSVEWTMDGRPIEVEADGYYTIPSGGGLLKATIEYAGGRRDIICKRTGGLK